MTDNDDTPIDDEQETPTSADDPPESSADTAPATQHPDIDTSARQRVVRTLQWAAFTILVLVALVATFRFYFAASNTINEFVTRRYRPPFQMVFNLVILLASVLGISVLVRKIV